ncbi:MAG: toll/interleukin-1 receptor domain-containing protein [Lachnospiraceae bacterium]|nr:toll/interleukin-1 receptor domain-containing protein [Lachnospiraceae bacterium]
MNIFISFSGTAREDFAIKFLNFFNEFGLHCWYDQHELFLGDNLKNTIINDGIEAADYCILIINESYLNRSWPCEEAKKLYEKLEVKKNNVIFPILLDITKEDVKNSKVNFLLNIKYQFLHTGDTINAIGLQILNRIFHDIATQYKFQTINDALNYFKRFTLTSRIDIYNALNVVNNFDNTNYKDRTIILTCLTNLFNNNPYKKTINKISYFIYENEIISFDMYKIVESIFLINASIFVV